MAYNLINALLKERIERLGFNQRKRIATQPTGEVVNKISESKKTYTISIAGKERKVKSAIAQDLDVGSRVILVSTPEGYYIVGSESSKNRDIREVVING